MTKRILYLGWIGFHNLGDEWMWKEFEALAQRYGDPAKIEIVPSLPGVDIQDLAGYETIVLGGGSLLIPGYVDLLYKAIRARKKIVIWGSGYDQMFQPGSSPDGGEFKNPAREGEEYVAKLQEVVGRAAYCGVRGPWTYRYLQERNVPMDNVVISGDPALMATAKEQGMPKEDRRHIAVNWGTTYGKIYGSDEAAVESELADACRRLVRNGHKLYLYVVWGSDRTAAKRLYDRIAAPESVTYDPEVRPVDEWLGLMPRFDASVNFKLHANILSAVCHVPFVSLGYRFKSLDFAHSLDLQRWNVPTDADDLSDRIVRLAEEGMDNRDLIRTQIAFRQEQAREMLRLPFLEQFY